MSRKRYSTTDIGSGYAAILHVDDDTDVDLLLDLTDLCMKNKRRRRHQARKLKKLYEELEEERKDLSEKLALKALCSALFTGSRQDSYNQKPISEKKYNGETSLGNFVDDLKTESIARNSWEALLCIPSTSNSSTYNLLESSTFVTEKDMSEARKSRTPAE